MEALESGRLFMDSLAAGGDVENVVSYAIYADSAGQDLEDLRAQVLQITLPYTHDYVWQRQEFVLFLSPQHPAPWERPTTGRGTDRDGSPGRPYLWGEVGFGDNIDDEWFVVSLLQRVSMELKDLSIRVWDNDGEFLLIEAAYSLPRWLKPESADNRVFLRGGALQIVPPPTKEHPSLPDQPTLLQALQVLQSEAVDTIAAPKVQRAIKSRLGGLPDKAQDMMHRARLRVPLRCAAVLSAEPSVVGPAVETFYGRDMDDMKAAARQRVFPGEEMVTVLCRFNRCLYSQLLGQVWEPPKDGPAAKAALLGSKLTAGMEMMVARGVKAAGGGHSEASAPPQNEKDVPGWQKFMQRLEAMDFFQGELKGSAMYRKLKESAWRSFVAKGPTPGASRQAELLARVKSVAEGPLGEFRSALEAAGPVGAEDDDSWVASAADELQEELDTRAREMEDYSTSKRKGEEEHSKGPTGQEQAEIEKLTARMGQFMQHISGVDGAEVPEASGQAVPNLDPSVFLRQLGRVLGLDKSASDVGAKATDQEEDGDDASSSEGSSFFSDDDEDDDSSGDDQERPRGAGGFHRAAEWDAQTATDSDDEEQAERAGFSAAYDGVLEDQLRDTTMAASFDRQEASSSGCVDQTGKVETGDGESGDGSELQPVDLDLNLVNSLLESFASQEGLPGPAGNFAGMLGVKLPKASKK